MYHKRLLMAIVVVVVRGGSIRKLLLLINSGVILPCSYCLYPNRLVFFYSIPFVLLGYI